MAKQELNLSAILSRTAPARLEVYAASIADGRGNTLRRRLFVVEVGSLGETRLRQPTVFLDLILAEAGAPVALPGPGGGGALPAGTGDPTFPAERGTGRQKELDTIARHVEVSLLTLIDRQQRQIADSSSERSKGRT